MVQAALTNLFAGTYQLLVAQEVPSTESAALMTTMLPGGSRDWRSAFFDTTDTMDNGVWYRSGITMRDAFPLFVTSGRDSAGRLVPDLTRTTHPPVVAQIEAGDFDFTLINLHLTFADGDTTQSTNELRQVLNYLDWYFAQPDHDPDVVVCGDFNTPSALSGQTGRNGITLDAVFDQDPRFQVGERRFVVTVHQPTSRSPASNGGLPANNYDHCVLSADTMEEFIQARRVATTILTDHPDDPEERLTSDHFPIVAFFRTRGDRVALDRRRTLRP
jgi:endonuclease/exonuclease/phosphatase family metal-dependent hydrolase